MALMVAREIETDSSPQGEGARLGGRSW
jgi:hypothetical protein